MLRLAWLVLLLAFVSSAPPAWAESWCGRYYGHCVVTDHGRIPAPGRPAPDDEPRPSRPVPERECRLEGRIVPCETSFGTWSAGRQTWCRPAVPQPPKDDPIWQGRADGSIWACVRPQGNVPDASMVFYEWRAAGDQPPRPDPEAVAWSLLAKIQLKPVEPGVAPQPLERKPDALGFVGMPLWFWVRDPSPNTVGPITDSDTIDGYTVTISAKLDSLEWDLGDGTEPVRCRRWRAFNPAMMDRETPVVCGRQEGYQREGEYTLRVTSHWKVSWRGVGEQGVIDFDRTTTRTLRIGEAQVLSGPTRTR